MLALSAALTVATNACAEEAAPVLTDAPAPATGDAAAPVATPVADPAVPAVAVAPQVAAPAAAAPQAAVPEAAAPLAPAPAVAPPAPPEASAPPAAAAPPSPPELQFEKFDDMGFIKARKSGAPVVLYFEADWCGPCQKMHATTFREPAVLEAAAGAHLFRIDMSKPDLYVDLVKKSFHVEGAPTVIVFGPGGRESARRFGFLSAKEFTKMLGESRKPPASS